MTNQNTVMTGMIHQKGGVGKSTNCANLAVIAAQLGKKTLVVDLDPQSSITIGLGMYEYAEAQGINLSDYEAARIFQENIPPSQLALPTRFGFDIIVSTDNLHSIEESFLASQRNGELILSRNLTKDKGMEQYDLVIFDTAGKLGKLTSSVLNACGDFIIADVATPVNLKQVPKVMDVVKDISQFRMDYQMPPCVMRGHFWNRAEPNTNTFKDCNESAPGYMSEFPDAHISDIYISKATRFGDAEDHMMPLVIFDDNHRAVAEYQALFSRLFPEFTKG
jgi:cellulose biosynthesis protein BcsQ